MTIVQKLHCQIEKITDHGEHVYTLDLLPERRAPLFKPGQFLHLALDEYDPSGFWPDSRVFSIANAPSQRDHLRIAYSVRGQFTARMERELSVGSWVWVKMPYGDFVIEATQDVVLIAGGTGVTAFTAFLDGLTSAFDRRICLVYGARNPGLLIYRDLIEEQARAIPQLQVLYFVEQPNGCAVIPRFEHTVIPGRIKMDAVWPMLSVTAQATFYLSGPPSMLAALSNDLRGRGIAPEAIRIDAWE